MSKQRKQPVLIEEKKYNGAIWKTRTKIRAFKRNSVESTWFPRGTVVIVISYLSSIDPTKNSCEMVKFMHNGCFYESFFNTLKSLGSEYEVALAFDFSPNL